MSLAATHEASYGRYTFTRGLDYRSVLAASEQVAWTVDQVFRGRRFDPSRPIVPASWVATDALGFLSDAEQLALNHCRAFSYFHLLGNFEEFAPPHIGDVVQRDWHGDRTQLRALLRFSDEEMKHQQLFSRAERVLEESCGHAFGRHFDDAKVQVTKLTRAVFDYPSLPRFLVVLALEWGTQRHYVESIRSRSDECADPLYTAILKAHWVEEAQHIKCDVLEIASLASAMRSEQLATVFDDVVALGTLVDVAFVGQAEEEIDTLEHVTDRRFSSAERNALRATLHESLGRIFAGVGLSHPSFAQVARELSVAGAAKLGIV